MKRFIHLIPADNGSKLPAAVVPPFSKMIAAVPMQYVWALGSVLIVKTQVRTIAR